MLLKFMRTQTNLADSFCSIVTAIEAFADRRITSALMAILLSPAECQRMNKALSATRLLTAPQHLRAGWSRRKSRNSAVAAVFCFPALRTLPIDPRNGR
jgi:hypothetical protein